MRPFLVLLVGFAAVPSALAAQAGSPPTLSLSVSSHKVLYSHRATLSGKLSAGRIAGRAVVVDAWAYGSSAPRVLAHLSTNANGGWSLRIKPGLQTTYQAHVGTISSPSVTVGVAPEVSVGLLANGRIRATILGPSHRFDRRFVELQSRDAHGTWTTLGRKRLSTASIAVFPATIPSSTIRVAMSINQAGAGYLGAASHALVYRAEQLTMAASQLKVLYGHRVTLTGRLVNGRAGRQISIIATPYGRKPFVLATVTTNRNGAFSFKAKPTIRTTYQAQFAGTRESQAWTVGVRPTITVHELSDGHLLARVDAPARLAGRMIQLQRLMGDNTWKTVAKRPLHANATATFGQLLLPTSTVRIALSVNQAGAGYLGSESHPLIYRAV